MKFSKIALFCSFFIIVVVTVAMAKNVECKTLKITQAGQYTSTLVYYPCGHSPRDQLHLELKPGDVKTVSSESGHFKPPTAIMFDNKPIPGAGDINVDRDMNIDCKGTREAPLCIGAGS